MKKIKVLIVDDSFLFRETLAREISGDIGIEVVGTAEDPFVARDKILEFKPDVVILDIEMPKMDGITFLRKLIPQYPVPVIVISSAEQNIKNILKTGAVNFIAKPKNKASMNSFVNEIISKIKIASIAKVKVNISDRIIAIGASTGGTDAIADIIKAFPKEMPGILIVQHMPPMFTKMFAERLNKIGKFDVKEAQNGDMVGPGKILVAAGGYHMVLVKKPSGYQVNCYKGKTVSSHCPSVDVLFDSVAKVAGDKAIGVLLTGMGSDGAKGLLNMRKEGAFTIGQDEKTSVVYGMPMVAFNMGAVVKQSPLNKIPREICNYLSLKL